MKTLVGDKSCGASVGGLWSDSSDSNYGADITCKLNIFKQSYFDLLSFSSLEYGCLVGFFTAP